MTRCLLVELGNIRFGVRRNVPYEIFHISKEVCIENKEVLRYHTRAGACVFSIFGDEPFKAILPTLVNDKYRADGELGDQLLAVTADVLLICASRGLRNGCGCLACRIPISILKIVPLKESVLREVNAVLRRKCGVGFDKVCRVELN